MSNYNKVVVTTPTYSVTDMAEGSTPICDTKILSGSSWNFNSEELPATVYYESTSVSKPKTYVFASDSHHVEMSTNRTLEEEYTSLLGKFGKEIDSPDGSAIQVNDGISGKVLKMSIKGKTVKSQAYNWKNTIIDYTTKQLGIWHSINNNVPCVIILKVAEIKNNPNLEVQVTYNTNLTAYPKTVLTNDGYYKIDLSTYGTNIRIDYIRIASPLENQSFKLVDYTIINKSDADYVLQTFNGLNSTQAILNNNGQSYPIYEPTIQGKTRILNSKLVSLKPSIEGLEALKDVPSGVCDTIDLANSLLSLNTFYGVLDGSLTYTNNGAVGNLIEYIINSFPSTISIPSGQVSLDVRCFNLPVKNSTTESCIFMSAGKLRIRLLNTINPTSYFTQNPTEVIYPVAAPTKIQLTPKEIGAYAEYKKVISLDGLEGARNKLELKEDGSAIFTQESKMYSSNYNTVTSTTNLGETTRFDFEAIGSKMNSLVLCDKVAKSEVNYESQEEHIYSGANKIWVFLKNTTLNGKTPTEWLKENTLHVIAPLDTPIITHIPKELLPTILTHNQTNILEVGGAVKPSSFKVTVPTTDGIKKEYTLTPINGWKGTAKANLLQTGDIGLVLDLTIPSSFNASICSLATELRPKAERTVLGYNGNTPVVVKIGTDGTIKLPISTTGTVKLDDTYKL